MCVVGLYEPAAVQRMTVEHFEDQAMLERPLFLTLRAFRRRELTPKFVRFPLEDFHSDEVGCLTFPATLPHVVSFLCVLFV